jgi:hypothetical protein
MAGTIRIAILANAAQARKEIQSVGGSAEGIGKKFSSLRAPAVAALGAIGIGAVGAVKSASDLNETVSKSNTIFGASAGSINSWAGGAAKNLGLSKSQALEAAAGFGDMFTQIGFAGGAAADMSKQVVQTSADLGSFNNLPTADVAERIQAGFRGEYDSLQKLIPNISAARVEQEAMAATGKKSAKELTAAEKATAVLAIVQKDGAKAAGDFAKTSDGAANSQKIAAATAADLSAGLGQQLLPAYTAVLQFATGFLTKMQEHQGVVTAVVAVVGALAVAVLGFSAAQAVVNTVMGIARAACVYFKRFYTKNAFAETDPFLVLIACVYVAAKVEECPVHVKSVLSEARACLSEHSPRPLPTDYTKLAEMEFYLLEELQFDMVVHHPYSTLMSVCGREVLDDGYWSDDDYDPNDQDGDVDMEPSSENKGEEDEDNGAKSILKQMKRREKKRGKRRQGETEQDWINRVWGRGSGRGSWQVDDGVFQMAW